jgi:hypothetical protein
MNAREWLDIQGVDKLKSEWEIVYGNEEEKYETI